MIGYRGGPPPNSWTSATSEPRRMTVDDLQIVFRPIEMHGGTAFKVPPDGSRAFSAFATPDFWEEQQVHERRRPRTVTHSIGSSIITGRTSPGYVRRNDVFPATLMTPEMLSAWLERAIIRPVGTFEEGRFVADGWFEDELSKFVWDYNDQKFWKI